MKYNSAANNNGAKVVYVAPLTVSEANIKSLIPKTDTIDVSLINTANSLPIAGNMFLIACGKSTFLKATHLGKPSALVLLFDLYRLIEYHYA